MWGFVCPATGGKKKITLSCCGYSSGTCDRFTLRNNNALLPRVAQSSFSPPHSIECSGIKEAEIKRDMEKEARDEGSQETQEKKEQEPDRQPEGHLKVNGMLLTPLVTHVQSPAPLGFISLACLYAFDDAWLAGGCEITQCVQKALGLVFSAER